MLLTCMSLLTHLSLPRILLLNAPDLLLHIHVLHMLQLGHIFAIGRAIVTQRRFLPTGLLFLADGLAGYTIEDVATLGGEPLEVVGHVGGREVGGGVACFGFGALFFPAVVQEFDCSLRRDKLTIACIM